MGALDEAEVRAIDEAMAMTSSSAAERSARPHTLVQPDNDARVLLRSLQQNADTIARAVESGLRIALRTTWEVTVHEPRVSDAGAIGAGAGGGAAAGASGVVGLTATSKRSSTRGALSVDDAAAHRIALMLLGGVIEEAGPRARLSLVDRQLTARALRTVFDEIVPQLPCEGVEVAPTGSAGDTDVSGAIDGCAGKSVTLELEANGPFALRLQLTVPTAWCAGKVRAATSARSFADHVPDVEIEMVVELGRLSTTLQRLMALQPGDVLPLATTEKSSLPVFVEGERRFCARPLTQGGRIAIEIVKNEPALPMEGLRASK